MLSKDRERLPWRCVDRRREEPAARRRSTDGPVHGVRTRCSSHGSPRSPSPCFIERRVSGDRPEPRRVPSSFFGGLRRGMTATGFGIRQDHAVHTSKTIGSKAAVSPRAAASMRRAPRPPSPPRGLCRPVASLADFRLTRVKRRSSHGARTARWVRLTPLRRFVSPRRAKSRRILAIRHFEVEIRSRKRELANAPPFARIRSGFGSR